MKGHKSGVIRVCIKSVGDAYHPLPQVFRLRSVMQVTWGNTTVCIVFYQALQSTVPAKPGQKYDYGSIMSLGPETGK